MPAAAAAPLDIASLYSRVFCKARGTGGWAGTLTGWGMLYGITLHAPWDQTALACCRDEAVREAEAAEQRAREAQAAAEQARGQQARQSALSEELRQALSQNQQLASQLEDVSAQSSQVRACSNSGATLISVAVSTSLGTTQAGLDSSHHRFTLDTSLGGQRRGIIGACKALSRLCSEALVFVCSTAVT